jgi:hypothetical protein
MNVTVDQKLDVLKRLETITPIQDSINQNPKNSEASTGKALYKGECLFLKYPGF